MDTKKRHRQRKPARRTGERKGWPTVGTRMPVSEVQLVDAAARVLGQDRAGFIRQALVYCSGVALRRAGGAPESVTTGEAP